MPQSHTNPRHDWFLNVCLVCQAVLCVAAEGGEADARGGGDRSLEAERGLWKAGGASSGGRGEVGDRGQTQGAVSYI